MKCLLLSALVLMTFLKCRSTDKMPANGLRSLGPGNNVPLNLAAGGTVMYELQVRAANACRDDIGNADQKRRCRERQVGKSDRGEGLPRSPKVIFKAKDWAGSFGCPGGAARAIAELEKIKLGTLDDLLEDHTDYHLGITLRYIKEKVGVNAIWIMPLFPNNMHANIPDECDNVGSPYAVRDYMHAKGSLDRFCIRIGKDEFAMDDGEGNPCWATGKLEDVIRKSQQLGLRVMLDMALNHFGHDYLFYDYVDFKPVRERISDGEDLNSLWSFAATEEAVLLHPDLLDSEEKLNELVAGNPIQRRNLSDLKAKSGCQQLAGDRLVRAFNIYRVMLDWERSRVDCQSDSTPLGRVYLESWAPGFYASSTHGVPSRNLGDNYTNNWSDVKFLYHHDNPSHQYEFVRNREYFFRILNYWVSRGVQGFRLDHTTDHDSGMAPNEWRYLLQKVNHYDWLRKGKPQNHNKPIYLAEEFHDQGGMAKVVDMMIDGYVGNMKGGIDKNTDHVVKVLENNKRFDEQIFVMTALETHDEMRLYENTGFNEWNAAGFWGIGAASRGTPMLLMGQEFGAKDRLNFRKSDLIESRFYDTPQHFAGGYDLIEFYRKMAAARLDHKNRALLGPKSFYLHKKDETEPGFDQRIFAQVLWTDDRNVVFTFFKLWNRGESVQQVYDMKLEIARQAGIEDQRQYKKIDVFTGKQYGACISGEEIRTHFYVEISGDETLQWIRLESC